MFLFGIRLSPEMPWIYVAAVRILGVARLQRLSICI